MISLIELTRLSDGSFYAKWRDEIAGLGFDFCALHHADGRVDVANMGIKTPALTAEQMAQAQPERPQPLDELVAKGIAARPDWANRYQKAAQLVTAGAVAIVDAETATVQGSQLYTVGEGCSCRWQQFHPGDPCSHFLAMRLQRALDRLVWQNSQEAIEARSNERARQAREAKVARTARRGVNRFEQSRQARRSNADGARQWLRAAYANGRRAFPTDIYNRANGGKKS